MSESFRILLNGIADSSKKDETINELAKLMRVKRDLAEELLSRKNVVIKSGVSKVLAEKYRQHVSATGALVDVENEAQNECDTIARKNENPIITTQSSNSDTIEHINQSNNESLSNDDTGCNKSNVESSGNKEFILRSARAVYEKLSKSDSDGGSVTQIFSTVGKNFRLSLINKKLIEGGQSKMIDSTMSETPTPWIFLGFSSTLVLLYIALTIIKAIGSFSIVALLIIFIQILAFPMAVLVLFFELNTPKNITINTVGISVFIGGLICISFILLKKGIYLVDWSQGHQLVAIVDYVVYIQSFFIYKFIKKNNGVYKLNYLLFGVATYVGQQFAIDLFNLVANYQQVMNVTFPNTPSSIFDRMVIIVILTYAYCSVRDAASGWVETIFSPAFWRVAIFPIVFILAKEIQIFSFGANLAIGTAIAIVGWYIIYKIWTDGKLELSDLTKN